jgi:hypothetical protein
VLLPAKAVPIGRNAVELPLAVSPNLLFQARAPPSI